MNWSKSPEFRIRNEVVANLPPDSRKLYFSAVTNAMCACFGNQEPKFTAD